MDARYLSCADTAKLVRKALKEKFPATKFSVVSSTYSMGASIRVRWTDGPTAKRVDEVVKAFEGATFDGMIDLKSYLPPTEMNGEKVHFGADYVFTERKHSDVFWLKVAKLVAAKYGVPVPKDEMDAGVTYVPHANNTDFRTMVWRAMGDRSWLVNGY